VTLCRGKLSQKYDKIWAVVKRQKDIFYVSTPDCWRRQVQREGGSGRHGLDMVGCGLREMVDSNHERLFAGRISVGGANPLTVGPGRV
jgi:hypothetical protein